MDEKIEFIKIRKTGLKVIYNILYNDYDFRKLIFININFNHKLVLTWRKYKLRLVIKISRNERKI